MRTFLSAVIVIGFFLNLTALQTRGYEPVLLYNSAGQPVFQYNYFNKGEPFRGGGTGNAGTWQFQNDVKSALERAGQFWVNTLNPINTSHLPVIYDIYPVPDKDTAFASPDLYALPQDSTTFITAPAFILQYGYQPPSDLPYHGRIGVGVSNFTYDLNSSIPTMPMNLESVMIHEIGHSLGIVAYGNPAAPTVFGKLLQGSLGNLYFTGPTASMVYGDGAIRNVPMEDSGDDSQDLSHFGVRNGLMTHRMFRNYTSFMEVEMAAFKDIGYHVDLRNNFGRSIYTSGTAAEQKVITNNEGFFARNADGTAYLVGQPNLTQYGIGLHIYGDYNTVYQNANLLADGPGAAGIRSDGIMNNLIVNPGVMVTANGPRGIGLLVSYGHDSTVVNRGIIQATGPDGDAVRFDIGVNLNDRAGTDPNGYGPLAMYSYYQKITYENLPPWIGTDEYLKNAYVSQSATHQTDMNGALVSSFDVTGSIVGSRSAIYIGGNSHVEAINIMNGASIQGRIISDYYFEGVNNSPTTKSTKLTFGLAADADGRAIIGTPDPNFRFTIQDDILGYGADNINLGYQYRYTGRGLFDVELRGGQTSLNYNAEVKVNKFTVESGAALLGQADFGFNRYSTVQANTINFKDGSLAGIDANVLHFGPDLNVNQKYHLIGLENFSGGTITNNSTPIQNSAPVMVGIYDYRQYTLEWDGEKHILNFSPTAAGERISRRAGDASVSAPVVAAVYDNGWQHILNRSWTAVTHRDGGIDTPLYRKSEHGNTGAAPASASTQTWAAPLVNYTHIRSDNGRDGYDGGAFGAAVGIEHAFTNDLLAGLAFSVSHEKMDGGGMETTGNANWNFATYGAYELPFGVVLGAALGGGYGSYDLVRRVHGNSYGAEYSDYTWRGGVSLGVPIAITEHWSLRPRVLADYLYINTDGYTESAGEFALHRNENSQNIYRTELLTELAWKSDAGIRLGVSVGWARLYGDRETEVKSSFRADAPDYNYFYAGSTLDRDSLTAGVNLTVPLSARWSLGADYRGVFGKTTASHSGEVKVGFTF